MMFPRSRTRAARVLAPLLVVIAACSESGGGLPVSPDERPPGERLPTAKVVGYRIVLDSPNQGDGALLLRVSGGPVDSVTSTSAQASTAPVGTTAWSVLLWGNLKDGPVATLWIPARDPRQSDAHRVVIEQVAALGSYRQRNPAGYTLRMERIIQ